MIKKLIKRIINEIKKLISRPVAQLDRATAFKKGACKWNIRKVISKGDYVYALVPEHPNATKSGYVLMHRIIMENHLGRLLNANEVVHHKDHNKKNNSIENLEVLNSLEHVKLHASEKRKSYVTLICPECGKTFVRAKNQTHLVKTKCTFNCTFCSRGCMGKFSRKVQLSGLTSAMEDAISRNVVEVFQVQNQTNLEETDL